MFEDVPQAADRAHEGDYARYGHEVVTPPTPHGAGFAASVRLATPHGWRPAHALRAGDEVITLDGGTQTVREIFRQPVWSSTDACPANLWPYVVPAGALGNTGALTLMQGQHVLFEEDAALEMFGVFSVGVPVTELEGYFGITRLAPVGRLELVYLIMDQNEVLIAEGGAMILCPAGKARASGDRAGGSLLSDEWSEQPESTGEGIDYPVLQPAHCESLLDELVDRGGIGGTYMPEPDYAALR